MSNEIRENPCGLESCLGCGACEENYEELFNLSEGSYDKGHMSIEDEENFGYSGF